MWRAGHTEFSRLPCGLISPWSILPSGMTTRLHHIAAVDIGTNSIHMIVAEMRKRGYRVVDREKEMVQLGLGSLDGAPLNDDAIDRAVSALKRMSEVARGWDVDE